MTWVGALGVMGGVCGGACDGCDGCSGRWVSDRAAGVGCGGCDGGRIDNWQLRIDNAAGGKCCKRGEKRDYD